MKEGNEFVRDEILFRKGIKIQGLNRVAIPQELLENANLKEGDDIVLYLNPADSSIILKKAKIIGRKIR